LCPLCLCGSTTKKRKLGWILYSVLLWPQATRKLDLCLSVQIRVQQKLKSNPFRFTRHLFLDTFHSTNKPINQSTISVLTCHSFLVTFYHCKADFTHFKNLLDTQFEVWSNRARSKNEQQYL
jgi:hypothetical protein